MRLISVLLWGLALVIGSGISGGQALAAIPDEGTTAEESIGERPGGSGGSGSAAAHSILDVDAAQATVDQSLNDEESSSFQSIERCLRIGRDLLDVVQDPRFAARKTQECFAAAERAAQAVVRLEEGEGGAQTSPRIVLGSVDEEAEAGDSAQHRLFVADCLREGWLTLDQVGASDAIQKTTGCLSALSRSSEEPGVGGAGVASISSIPGSGLGDSGSEPQSVGTGGSPVLDDGVEKPAAGALSESSQEVHLDSRNVEGTSPSRGATTVPFAAQLLQKDADVQKAFKSLLIATYTRQAQQLGEWHSVITWTNALGYIMFFVVHALIIVALVAACLEFKHALDTRKGASPSGEQQRSELSLSAEGVALKTSLHGILLIAAAFSFYFLYLRFVYPITVIKLG